MKIINKLANIFGNEWFAFSVGILFVFLFARCTPDPYYICSDVFTPEEVLIEGEPFTIYHKELVCEEIY